jgi:hypothetical protein
VKFITLLTAAYVGGALRHPHEGAIPVEDGEAERLVKDKVATDVTDGFTADQVKEATPETITAPGGSVEQSGPTNPHQAEIKTNEPSKPRTRKPADDKE